MRLSTKKRCEEKNTLIIIIIIIGSQVQTVALHRRDRKTKYTKE